MKFTQNEVRGASGKLLTRWVGEGREMNKTKLRGFRECEMPANSGSKGKVLHIRKKLDYLK
jgi:hypothetical protein